MLAGTDIPWAVAVVGGDALTAPVTKLALERGAHLRVGLEDDAEGADNAAIVRKAAALCEEAGRPVATLAEAETILGLT
jgi:uncharacterized protein (DUF849 family)